MTQEQLQAYLREIPGADRTAMDAAQRRQAALAKPPGSLGKLEEIAIRLAGVTGMVKNAVDRRCILVFAADNGVVAEGVSCAPQSVTCSQAVNMTKGLTGMSSMARSFGDEIRVVDVGMAQRPHCEALISRRVRAGTGNLAREPAMTRQEVLQAMAVGMEQAAQAKRDGIQAIGIGEMGIGNTTTSSAVLCALTGAPVNAVTGRGGGLTDDGFSQKLRVIGDALALHKPDPADPADCLAKVGGLDLAAMTGAFLACAKLRVPAVVDGLISIVAALCAVRLCSRVRDVLFLSHASCEPGYRLAADELALSPCLLLDMRLGEGSGCPLQFQVMRAACAVMNGMATFAEAAIQDGYLEEIRKIDAFTVEKR